MRYKGLRVFGGGKNSSVKQMTPQQFVVAVASVPGALGAGTTAPQHRQSFYPSLLLCVIAGLHPAVSRATWSGFSYTLEQIGIRASASTLLTAGSGAHNM